MYVALCSFVLQVVRPNSHVVDATSIACVHFDDIDNTVLALNELKGMKIGGLVIDIKPCSREFYKNSLREADPRSLRDEAVDMESKPPPFRQDFDGSRSRVIDDRPGHHGRQRSPMSRHNRGRYDSSRSDSPPRSIGRRHHRSRSPRDKDQLSRSSHDRRSSSHSQHDGNDERSAHRNRSHVNKDVDAASSHRAGSDGSNKGSHGKVPSWCIVVTGLPPKTMEKDLASYLSDVDYDKSMIQLLHYKTILLSVCDGYITWYCRKSVY